MEVCLYGRFGGVLKESVGLLVDSGRAGVEKKGRTRVILFPDVFLYVLISSSLILDGFTGRLEPSRCLR